MAGKYSPYNKSNLGDAKAYLRSVPSFKPAKSLDAYKPDQLVRKANAFARQQASGLTPDNRFARGKHKDDASGFSKSLQKSYKVAEVKELKAREAPPSQRGVNNARRFVQVHDKKSFNTGMRQLGRVAHDQNTRVKISFLDKRTGRYRTLGQKGGFTKKYIRQAIRDYGSLAGAIAALYGLIYSDDIDEDDIGDDFEMFSVDLGNA